MAFMLTYLKVPLSWGQVFRRTFSEAFFKDNCLGMAAQLAYYFFFALFPTLLVLLAIASYFSVEDLINDVIAVLGGFAPPEALRIIREQIDKISQGEPGGLLTIGMLAALWSSSAAMTAIIDTLNNAYDIEEGRPWWKIRLTAIGLTVGVATFILIAMALILVGPRAAEYIADTTRLGTVFEWTWKILQWPLAFALAATAMAIVYYYAPDAEQDWVWLTPGSIFATTLWLLTSLGFKYYVATVGAYDAETYGAIGGVMVLMLWFYISGLVILIGAEMNAEIEHASPYGKDAGEKVPGQKRKIGPAAMRAWIARRRQRGEKAPSAGEVKELTGPTPPDKQPGAPTGDSSTPASLGPIAPSVRRSAPMGVRATAPTPLTSFSDYVIGAGVVLAHAWWTIRSFRKRLV